MFLVPENVKSHPMAGLQTALGSGQHLQIKQILDIDDVTSEMLTTLRSHHLQAYGSMTNEEITQDLLVQRKVLGCNIVNTCQTGRNNSIEMTLLRQRGLRTVKEVVISGRHNMDLLV